MVEASDGYLGAEPKSRKEFAIPATRRDLHPDFPDVATTELFDCTHGPICMAP